MCLECADKFEMAETAGFFGFDTSIPNNDTGAWDEDEASRSSNAKNDETFGPDAGAWPKLGEVGGSRHLVSKLESMKVSNGGAGGFPDDPAIMSLQEKPLVSMPDRSAQLQNMEKIWGRPQQPPSNPLQNMEKIWNQAPPPPQHNTAPSGIAPPPGFGPPPGFAPRQEPVAPPMPGNIGTADSIVGNLVQQAGPGNIGPPGAPMQRGLNVEELERQHFAEGLDALSRRGTMVGKDSREFEAAQVVAQEIRQPPQGKFPIFDF